MNTPSAIDDAVDKQHPWLGLASFSEATRGYFYGRDDEIAELARRVQRKLVTVLFGQSGLGKTSILHAGLVPRLRAESFCPVYVRVDYDASAIAPSAQIKQAVMRATAAVGTWTKPGAAVEGESLWEFLHHRDDELLDADGRVVTPLLIFDQFEEIFTLAQADAAGRQRAAEFIEDLADLVENRPPKALEAKMDRDDSVADEFDFSRADYRILITLREDYLPHLEGAKASMPSITQNRMRLARMNGEQALAAVMKPGGKLLTQEVAESIVRFVAGGRELRNAEVEPSLLSLICRELNNARIALNRKEITADLIAGSNATILAEFYERALADQPAAVRKVIEDELLTDSGHRENIAEERVLKLFAAAGARPDAASTLATLVNRRLLRIEERLDVRRVELTHDVLSAVVKASRMERNERETLAEAERKLAEQQERERATRKALVHARQIAVGCAMLAVVAVVSAVFGIASARRARIAEDTATRTQVVSETSRAEAERLLSFIVDDFYEEAAPLGLVEVVGALTSRTVDYYRQLPPEALTVETRRNSAIAQARYAQSLFAAGMTDEATVHITEATATMTALREAGDTSVDSLVAEAQVSRVAAIGMLLRADFPGTSAFVTTALERLQPAVADPRVQLAAKEVQAQLYGSLGNALYGNEQLVDAVAALRQAREISRELGALELSDLPLTAAYIGFGTVLADSLIRGQSGAEALPILQDTIALADRLLALRPVHRPTLQVKRAAYDALSQAAYGNMQMAEMARYANEAYRVQEQIVALDPGTSSLRQEFRNASEFLAYAHWAIGDVEETLRLYDMTLAIGENERVENATALFLINTNLNLARFQAELGNTERRQFYLGEAKRYEAMTINEPGTELQRSLTRANAAWLQCEVATLSQSETELAAALANAETMIAEVTNVAGDDREGMAKTMVANLFEVCEWTALAANQSLVAEAYARQGLETYGTGALPLWGQLSVAEFNSALARALTLQGRNAEAATAIQRALAFYQVPAVQQSDNQWGKFYHSRTLLVAAGVYPADKGRYLQEATALLASAPPAMQRLQSFARLAEDIAQEQGR